MEAAHRHRTGAVYIVPIGKGDVLGLDHGDLGLCGASQLVKGQVVVVPAEAVAAPHAVFQVGAGQGGAAVKKAHPQDLLDLRSTGSSHHAAETEGGGQEGCHESNQSFAHEEAPFL